MAKENERKIEGTLNPIMELAAIWFPEKVQTKHGKKSRVTHFDEVVIKDGKIQEEGEPTHFIVKMLGTVTSDYMVVILQSVVFDINRIETIIIDQRG